MKQRFSNIFVAVFAVCFAGGVSAADWTPSGPIKMQIGFAAGGGADTQARFIAKELEARHGWRVIPSQLTGGGGTKLAAALKNEPNDGLSIGLIVTESIGYNMVAARNPGYELKDFTPITTTAGFQMGIVSLSRQGWMDIDDVAAAAKGGKVIRFGTMSPKLADLAWLLGEAQDVDFNIISSYRGGRAVFNALNAGDIDVGFVAGIQAGAVANGEMVNLASALSVPLEQTPKAKTLKQLGVPFNADGYFVFIAPQGIPKDARKALAENIGAIVSDEKTEAGAFIKKAFGGAAVLQGRKLDRFLRDGVRSAEKLLKATSE